jgi:hypothetical protein
MLLGATPALALENTLQLPVSKVAFTDFFAVIPTASSAPISVDDLAAQQREMLAMRTQSAGKTLQAKPDNQRMIARLNHYLAGSPLAGQGKNFAAAATRYHIDPRLSVAISNIESGKGKHQANRYNAWGMRGGSGWQRFSSWKNAIDSHAAFIARHYGANVTPERMAHSYCPPSWRSWSKKVRREMNSI